MTSPTPCHGAPPTGTANWKLEGACVGEPQDTFFPTERSHAVEAKKICATCPVREQCFAYAMELNIQHGIWGGTSAHERNRIRRRAFRARLASVPVSSARGTGAVPSVARPVGSAGPGRAAHHP